MKVKNYESTVINVVLPDGEKHLGKGDTCDMPKWVFSILSKVFPGLKAVEEAKIVSGPEKAEPKPAEKPKEVKSAKNKKSGK